MLKKNVFIFFFLKLENQNQFLKFNCHFLVPLEVSHERGLRCRELFKYVHDLPNISIAYVGTSNTQNQDRPYYSLIGIKR